MPSVRRGFGVKGGGPDKGACRFPFASVSHAIPMIFGGDRALHSTPTKRRYCVGRLSATELARARIFQNLIQNLSGPRSGENFSKPQWVPACWLLYVSLLFPSSPNLSFPLYDLFTTSANAERFAKYPPSVLRAAQPRTQPRLRTYAASTPLRRSLPWQNFEKY